ncbi:Bifunctional protein MdtA [Planctomycetes bacterium Pan216]|uniref:Bifunctional protein MdtA n=1 Tax=Kolteria novifilia TaxID=2527975 RepID=A0A518BCZ2_9BACT|nr:Bifunctional protein MdtA [Planctomycetes bacterium Pan216]
MKPKILLQLDADKHPSAFDAVVAIDAGVDHLLSHGAVEPEEVESLVHGAIFTRGPSDLKSTAIFIGGHSVARGEELLANVTKTFFGPMRTSVMLDSNGANTTAAAAVIAAGRHLDFEHTRSLVLGGTGPVGQRVALLLARQGAKVELASRSVDRAADACAALVAKQQGAAVEPLAFGPGAKLEAQYDLIVAAGAAGAQLISKEQLGAQNYLHVVVDLNAVPPAGIEGIDPMDAGREESSLVHYGAIGVGGIKMKIHKAAIARLFESNDQVFDAAEIHDLGLRLEAE